MKALGTPFNHLNLIVDSFQPTGIDEKLAMVENSIGISFQHFCKRRFHHLDSTKMKERFNLYPGHRCASSGLVLLIQIPYPEESTRCPFLLGLLINYLGEEPIL